MQTKGIKRNFRQRKKRPDRKKNICLKHNSEQTDKVQNDNRQTVKRKMTETVKTK